MNIPLLIIIIFLGLSWAVDLVDHGKIEKRRVNAHKTFVGTIALLALIHLAIIYGG